MVLKGRAYIFALKSFHSPKMAKQRSELLLKRIMTQIEKITLSLNQNDILDKILKSRISLLSSLLEVKKKIRVELKEMASDSGKQTESLGELLK